MTAQDTVSILIGPVAVICGVAALGCHLVGRFERWGGARRARVVIACRVFRRRIPRRLADMPGHPDRARPADLNTNATFLQIVAGLHGARPRRFAGTWRHR